LGVIIGIQFLFWTISGLYFSWTDIDEIHGDHLLKEAPTYSLAGLQSGASIDSTLKISAMELRFIASEPYFWVNDSMLFSVKTGKRKAEITKEEAIGVVKENLVSEIKIKKVAYLNTVTDHHEYRGGSLPAWVIHFDQEDELTAYVAAVDGRFQKVRHNSWRWFDFLWMTHTMDYEGRDNFNNTILRAFSLLGLITVLSGFLLWYISSPTVRKILQPKKKNRK
jgi:uncharacterized iron-regulated membrane protein